MIDALYVTADSVCGQRIAGLTREFPDAEFRFVSDPTDSAVKRADVVAAIRGGNTLVENAAEMKALVVPMDMLKDRGVSVCNVHPKGR